MFSAKSNNRHSIMKTSTPKNIQEMSENILREMDRKFDHQKKISLSVEKPRSSNDRF
jgi:hypothetical protein